MNIKRFFRLSILTLFFVTAQAFPSAAYNPEHEILPLSGSNKVDSLYNLLSPEQRINMLIVVRQDTLTSDSLLYSAGAIAVKNVTANSKLYDIDTITAVMPMVFYETDNTLNFFGIDDINKVSLEAVNKPPLFYELGMALGKKCRRHGFQGILADSIDLRGWRVVETNTGIKTQGVLPMGFTRILPFDSITAKAIMTGDELLMFDVPHEKRALFHDRIKAMLREGVLTEPQLEVMVKRVFAAGMWVKSKDNENIDEKTPRQDSIPVKLLEQELAAASLTVLKNDNSILPVRRLAHLSVASVAFGEENDAVFHDYLNKYTQVDAYSLDGENAEKLWSKLKDYDLIITAFHEGFLQKQTNVTGPAYQFLQNVTESGKGIAVLFGSAESLKSHEILMHFPALVVAWADNQLYHSLVPQLIFGGIGASGTLPFGIEAFKKNTGQIINDLGRFSYTFPEAAGMNGDKLGKVDSIVTASIRIKAMPGCQVLAVRDGKVIFQKAYGYHTYDSVRAVRITDIYDLASVTKVSSTLPCLMKLHDEGKFDLDATLGEYLPYFKNSNKGNVTFREILAHQAGLKPWIAYWKTTIKKNGKFKRKTLSHNQSVSYPYEIADGLYLHKDYKKKIYKQIKKSPMGEKKYLYSGLVFYLFPEIIERLSGQPFVDYLYENFYYPLGATTLTYNPSERFDIDRIVPTEYDSLFRKTQIHGKVHDEGAAMMRGVSCNAGLFANANDLAKLFQMYCNYGFFGGREYVSERTVREFARVQYPENDNRRGLGFDKPMPEPKTDGNAAVSASKGSFGHSGFTGTFAWADPGNGLVYIFLSNRVYPTRVNRQLYDLNIRTNIQEAFYEAMKK